MSLDQDLYCESLKELFSLGRFGIKLGLETITAMLDAVGNPQERFRAVHIAGTNGKGSVAAGLASVLHRAGFRVGVYTSPHLVSINERFCVDGRPVTDGEVLESYLALKKTKGLDRSPTFFEYTTAMAFRMFAALGVDWAVVETGMGGRLDATNVIRPELSVITNISREHQFYLGGTVARIAAEKGGIIKEGVPVVTAARQKSVVAVLSRIAEERRAPLYLLGRDFSARRRRDGSFDYRGLGQRLTGVGKALPGAHQVTNAALVMAAAEILSKAGVNIPEEAVRAGLKSVRWLGRLSEVSRSPRIILDGAHNRDAMGRLAAHLDRSTPPARLIVVAGFLEDKPYARMMGELAARCRRIHLTSPSVDRAVSPERVLELCPVPGGKVRVAENVAEALSAALSEAGLNDTVLVTGSLYMVGEALVALRERGLWDGDFRLWDDMA